MKDTVYNVRKRTIYTQDFKGLSRSSAAPEQEERFQRKSVFGSTANSSTTPASHFGERLRFEKKKKKKEKNTTFLYIAQP